MNRSLGGYLATSLSILDEKTQVLDLPQEIYHLPASLRRDFALELAGDYRDVDVYFQERVLDSMDTPLELREKAAQNYLAVARAVRDKERGLPKEERREGNYFLTELLLGLIRDTRLDLAKQYLAAAWDAGFRPSVRKLLGYRPDVQEGERSAFAAQREEFLDYLEIQGYKVDYNKHLQPKKLRSLSDGMPEALLSALNMEAVQALAELDRLIENEEVNDGDLLHDLSYKEWEKGNRALAIGLLARAIPLEYEMTEREKVDVASYLDNLTARLPSDQTGSREHSW
ncbi:MAG: hypothetical protein HY519_00400 [Candidatus Aenigmarchaeota archaeon]|nr:hypothetical protein [Candidatus Aenigmarchaeota archaeon]